VDPLKGTLFVVDDDPKARKAVAILARSLRIQCETFTSGEAFLDYYQPSLEGCLLIDLRLEGMSGLQLQERLMALGSLLPVILISAYATVPLTVQGIRNGALTLLEKPYLDDELTDAILDALARNIVLRESHTSQQDTKRQLETFAPLDQEIVKLVIDGMPNKRIAKILKVSQRTIERRRAMVLEKMGVESAIELAQKIAGLASLSSANAKISDAAT
jgi:FixJ family two-component response regulator